MDILNNIPSWYEFITGDFFKYIMFPFGSAGLGIFIKIVTRNDAYNAFEKEDLAVGLDLMLSGILMYILLATDFALKLKNAQAALSIIQQNSASLQSEIITAQSLVLSFTEKLSKSGWIIFAMLIALWSVSTIVRKWGWEQQNKLNPITGITIPLSSGVLFLIVVMSIAS